MKKKCIYILIALAVLAVGYFLYKRHKKTTNKQEDTAPVVTPQQKEDIDTDDAGDTDSPNATPKRKAQAQVDDEPVSTEDVKPTKTKVPRYGQKVITAVPYKPSVKKLIIDGKH